MNLLERNNHNDENEIIDTEDNDIIEVDLDKEEDDIGNQKSGMLKNIFKQSNSLTVILLGIILVLLLCIIVLLLLLPGKNKSDEQSSNDALQQSITDYAYEQKQNDTPVNKPDTGAIVVNSSDVLTHENTDEEAITNPIRSTNVVLYRQTHNAQNFFILVGATALACLVSPLCK